MTGDPDSAVHEGRPRTPVQKVVDRLEMAGARFMAGVAWLMPGEAWIGRLGHALGPLVPGLLRRVRDNLRLVRPDATEAEARRLTAEVCAGFAHIALEYLHLGKIAADPDRVVIEDAAPLLAALDQGRGVIITSAHFGNWEAVRLAVRKATTQAGKPRDCALMRRAFNNPLFDAWAQTMIAHAGEPVLHKGREGTRGLLRLIARRGVVLMLIDQRNTGAPLLPFLGQPAETLLAPAELALRFKSALIPARALRLPDGRFSVRFEAEIAPTDPVTMMTEANARIGAWVEEAPGQWFWLHRRWKTRPRGEHIRAARGED